MQLTETAPSSARRPRPSCRSALRAHQQELVERYTPIVRQIASSFQRRLPCNVLRDDLVAAGMSGLWDAVQKHGSDERSTNFEWYVRVRVRGAILDELRAQDWLPRRARAAVNKARREAPHSGGAPVVVRIDDVSDTEQARCLAHNEGEFDTESEVARRLEREALERVIAQLPERERHIVAMHYFRGVKFKDLGKMLGVSEPRISQLHSRAMGRLRGLFAESAA
jgi:RNA polymerase sigma factor for flagellar operon FliA